MEENYYDSSGQFYEKVISKYDSNNNRIECNTFSKHDSIFRKFDKQGTLIEFHWKSPTYIEHSIDRIDSNSNTIYSLYNNSRIKKK